MKAAVLHTKGDVPRYEDFPDPVPAPDEEVLRVRAIALENVERATVAGTHFASAQLLPHLPAVVGIKGIAVASDGRLVGFGGVRSPYGAMAELVPVGRGGKLQVPIPEGVTPGAAAAVFTSLASSLVPLQAVVKLEPGQTVLVNGATGFAGRLAVQVARLLGAGRVIGSGRDPEGLREIRGLGADAVIDLAQPDASVLASIRSAEENDRIDVVLDYLWGHPTELLLRAFTPDRLIHPLAGERRARRTRLVEIGESAGAEIRLAADAVRTAGVEILSASGGQSPESVARVFSVAWEWIRASKVRADVREVPLRDVESAWRKPAPPGARIILVP